MVMERDPQPMNIEFLTGVVKVLRELLLLKKMGEVLDCFVINEDDQIILSN